MIRPIDKAPLKAEFAEIWLQMRHCYGRDCVGSGKQVLCA